jgi:hypothetical protein
MKFILYIMLFTTTPTSSTKIESKDVWTLQSTSQIEFHDQKVCWDIGRQLVEAVKPVTNMTMRAWCLCDPEGKTCPPEIQPQKVDNGRGFFAKKAGSGATIESIPSQ